MCSLKYPQKIFTVKIVNSLGVRLAGINLSSVEVNCRPVVMVMTFFQVRMNRWKCSSGFVFLSTAPLRHSKIFLFSISCELKNIRIKLS